MSIRTLKTLFITSGASTEVSKAAADLISSLVITYNDTTTPLTGKGSDVAPVIGSFSEFRLGDAVHAIPKLDMFDIVVYWDTYKFPNVSPSPTPSRSPSGTPSASNTPPYNMFGPVTPSNTPSPSPSPSAAPALSLPQCREFGKQLKPWLMRGDSSSSARNVVMDARVLSTANEDGSGLSDAGRKEITNEWLALAASAHGGLLVLTHATETAATACVNGVMSELQFTQFAVDASQKTVAPSASAQPAAGNGSVANGTTPLSTAVSLAGPISIAANERSTLWMCPSSSLSLSDRSFKVFGRTSRYTIGGGSGGGVAPYGAQPNGLYLQGLAYYRDDLSKPAVSSTLKRSDRPQQLQASIAAPANGRSDLRSCDKVRFTANLTRLSGAPPYTVIWYDTVLLPDTKAGKGADASASGGAGGEGSLVGGPVATIIALYEIDAASASSLSMPQAITFNTTLTNGTHRIGLVVRDAEGSKSSSSITITVQDVAADARAQLKLARDARGLRDKNLRNMTLQMEGTERATEAAIKRLEKLGAETGHREQVVNDTEAAAAKTATDVGSLQGKLKALKGIQTDREAILASLASEVADQRRLIADATLQLGTLQKQAAMANGDAEAVETLKSTLMQLQQRVAELEERQRGLGQQAVDTRDAVDRAKMAVQEAAVNATAAYEAMKKQIEDNKPKVAHATAETGVASTKLATLKHELATTNGHLDELTAKNTPLQGEVEALSASIHATTDSLNAAHAQAVAADTSAQGLALKLQQALATMDTKLDIPEGAKGLDAVAANRTIPASIVVDSEYAGEVRALETKRAEKQDALNAAKRELRSKESKEAQKKTYMRTLDEHLKDQKAEHDRTVKELEETHANIASATAGIVSAEGKLKVAITAQQESTAHLAAMKQEVAALEARRTSLKHEIEQLDRDEARWRAFADDLDTAAAAKKQAKEALAKAQAQVSQDEA